MISSIYLALHSPIGYIYGKTMGSVLRRFDKVRATLPPLKGM